MLKSILVPTDGSAESEKALQVAEQLARAQDAEIILAQVIESPAWLVAESEFGASPDIYQQIADSAEAEAKAGLSALEQELLAKGIKASTVTRQGHAAGSLLDCVAEIRPDLVVMATHGRGGLARFAMGSVADRMVREGDAPVLVVRTWSDEPGSLNRALVTLDGSDVAEEALPMAEALAGKPLQTLLLVRALKDESERAGAEAYFARIGARIAKTGLKVETLAQVGKPPDVIEAAAETVDMVIVCTHGHGGFHRLRHGGVAEHVMQHVDKPSLLVRASHEPDKH
ncbi:MAG: universal stress protein [Chloroflexi bacterium]|nr:universal stress protein [Chloroflexota bacterium]